MVFPGYASCWAAGKPTTIMKNPIIALCMALGIVAGASAQDLAVATTATPDHSDTKCMMKSTATTWQAIGISAEKSKQAQAIVDRCSKEHAGLTEEQHKKLDPTTGKEAHVKELNSLLTAEEFKRWEEWCSKQDEARDKGPEKKY